MTSADTYLFAMRDQGTGSGMAATLVGATLSVARCGSARVMTVVARRGSREPAAGAPARRWVVASRPYHDPR